MEDGSYSNNNLIYAATDGLAVQVLQALLDCANACLVSTLSSPEWHCRTPCWREPDQNLAFI